MRVGQLRTFLSIYLIILSLGGVVLAVQFTNRYPKVEGYRHHIYLEGYELPILGRGPIDPATHPDDRRVAIADRGWLWLLDLTTGVARRITRGPQMDSRPAWSPDGQTLAFVQDSGADTGISALDVTTGRARELVNTGAIDLDPVYSTDGDYLYFSSAEAGDLDLWRMELTNGIRERLTEHAGLEVRPLPLPDGRRVVYTFKTRFGQDEIRLLDLETRKEETLKRMAIASQTRPALNPAGDTLAIAVPEVGHWELWLLDIEDPDNMIRLVDETGPPISPAWSSKGDTLFFSVANEGHTFQLKSVPRVGGKATPVEVNRYDWGAPTTTVQVLTRNAAGEPQAARLSVVDSRGHPLLAESGLPRFDSQNGMIYQYSDGQLQVVAPVGQIEITAVRGLSTIPVTITKRVESSDDSNVEIELVPVWDPSVVGWQAGDHHFHLNYGGPYQLHPSDLVPIARGENLDFLTPLVANLHTRFEDVQWWNWKHDERPFIRFGQEIRSHFLGHLGLIGIERLFWPWIWGPGYPVYGHDDRPNAEALEFASQQQGGVGSYVHPVSFSDPFTQQNLEKIPIELVPDAVLGDLDSLEVACLWSDELGTAELWYRFLNLGQPVALSAGTDAFPNFFRSMALGTTRIYVRSGKEGWQGYLDALGEGKSWVTNGPLLDFDVNGESPCGTVTAGRVGWSLTLHSALPVQHVELIVNGKVVWRGGGLEKAGTKTFVDEVDLPEAGWLAVRAYGGETVWPAMDSYPFAHTSPVWINRRGSRDPEVARQAAVDLLRALTVAEAGLQEGYAGVEIPALSERFRRARTVLEQVRSEQETTLDLPESIRSRYEALLDEYQNSLGAAVYACRSGNRFVHLVAGSGGYTGQNFFYDQAGKEIDQESWSDVLSRNKRIPKVDLREYECHRVITSNPSVWPENR